MDNALERGAHTVPVEVNPEQLTSPVRPEALKAAEVVTPEAAPVQSQDSRLEMFEKLVRFHTKGQGAINTSLQNKGETTDLKLTLNSGNPDADKEALQQIRNLLSVSAMHKGHLRGKIGEVKDGPQGEGASIVINVLESEQRQTANQLSIALYEEVVKRETQTMVAAQESVRANIEQYVDPVLAESAMKRIKEGAGIAPQPAPNTERDRDVAEVRQWGNGGLYR